MREKIDAFIREWERKAKADTFLDAHLHQRIRKPLIDGIMAIAEEEMLALAGQKPDRSQQNDAAPRAPRTGKTKA